MHEASSQRTLTSTSGKQKRQRCDMHAMTRLAPSNNTIQPSHRHQYFNVPWENYDQLPLNSYHSQRPQLHPSPLPSVQFHRPQMWIPGETKSLSTVERHSKADAMAKRQDELDIRRIVRLFPNDAHDDRQMIGCC